MTGGNHLKPQRANQESCVREDLGLDSMSTIELVYQIEEVFDLEVPNEDLTKLTTVSSVVDYVENRLNLSGKTKAQKQGKS